MAASIVTVRFCDYGSTDENWTNPENSVDNNLATLAETTVDEDIQEMYGLFPFCQENHRYWSNKSITTPKIYTGNCVGQTFTPQETHTCDYIYVKARRSSTMTENVTVAIKATSSGVPSGATLASSVLPVNSLTAYYDWVKFEFSSPITLQSSTTYAFTFTVSGGDSSTYYLLIYVDNNNNYPRGTYLTSSNNGSSWSADTGKDLIFVEGNDITTSYITKIETRMYGYGDGNDQWWLGWDDDRDGNFGDLTSNSSPAAWSNWTDVTFYTNNLSDTNQPYDVYEYYVGSNDAFDGVLSNTWRGQTFTPDTTHTIDWVRLTMNKLGSPADDFYIDIYPVDDIIDYHPQEDQTGDFAANTNWDNLASAGGQCFYCDTSKDLESVKFMLKKSGAPAGNATAVLYDMTGTAGSTGKPTGSALATSNNYAISSLTTSYQLIEFTFGTPYTLSASTWYCIVYQNPSSGVNGSNYVLQGRSTGGHTGNACYRGTSSTWTANSGQDTIFYCYDNDNDEPIGSRLGGGKLTADYINTGASAWYTIPLPESVEVLSGIRYAMVFNSPSSVSGNYYNIYYDTTSPDYTRGSRVYSSNGGSSWDKDTGTEFNFYEGSNWWNFDSARFIRNNVGSSALDIPFYIQHNDISKGGISYIGAIETKITYITVITDNDLDWPLADDANATDLITTAVEHHLADDANASDLIATKVSITLTETASATDLMTSIGVREFLAEDTAKATDLITLLQATYNIADDANASDILTLAAAKQLVDDANATDLVTSSIGVTILDHAAGTDLISFKAEIPLADDANAVDAATFKAEIPLADDANADDAITFIKAKYLELTEQAKATDLLTTAVTKLITDDVAATDLATFIKLHLENFADTAKASDAVAFKVEIPLIDDANASDIATFITEKYVSILDTAKASDTISLGLYYEIADQAKAIDAAAFKNLFQIADTAKATDAITKLQAGFNIVDDANADDLITTEVFHHLVDDANATDTISKLHLGFQIADDANASDAATFITEKYVSILDTAKATDIIITAVETTILDDANASDLMNYDHWGGNTHYPVDTAKASDALVTAVTYHIADQAKATDLISYGFFADLTDAAAASDLITFKVELPILDTAKATDAIIKLAATRNIADIAKASDVITTLVKFNIADDANASDGITIKSLFGITDLASASDIVTTAVLLNFADSAKAIDVILFGVETPFSDTGKATDIVGFKVGKLITDIAKATEILTTSVKSVLTDTAKATDKVSTLVRILITDVAKAFDAMTYLAEIPATLKSSILLSESLRAVNLNNVLVESRIFYRPDLRSIGSNE